MDERERELPRVLAAGLTASGALRTPRWIRAFETVPRHVFVPVIFTDNAGAYEQVDDAPVRVAGTDVSAEALCETVHKPLPRERVLRASYGAEPAEVSQRLEDVPLVEIWFNRDQAGAFAAVRGGHESEGLARDPLKARDRRSEYFGPYAMIWRVRVSGKTGRRRAYARAFRGAGRTSHTL